MKNTELFENCRKAELEVDDIFSRDTITDDEFDTLKIFLDLWSEIEEKGLKKSYIHYCLWKEERACV